MHHIENLLSNSASPHSLATAVTSLSLSTLSSPRVSSSVMSKFSRHIPPMIKDSIMREDCHTPTSFEEAVLPPDLPPVPLIGVH